jgi:gamma-glutamyltranspeptidase/glutathione hydrolase
LADLLETLAKRNSVDSFYRGDVAKIIAEAFREHDGLVSETDLAEYRAHEVTPLSLTYGQATIWTAPLTAGGLTMLQALRTLQQMKWTDLEPRFARTHAQIEALRLAWKDRLSLLGDPEHSQVPVQKLLSAEYAKDCAERIAKAVREGSILPGSIESPSQAGTLHISAIDGDGNMVSLSFTHGNHFGSGVTVDGLGLTLGQGMSRFNPNPDHPNGPGPGKRPLHNMCPTIVTEDDVPVLALGGWGGRRIVNAVFEVLLQSVLLGKDPAAALAAPRLHTEGGLEIGFEKTWSESDVKACRSIGYRPYRSGQADIAMVSYDPAKGKSNADIR